MLAYILGITKRVNNRGRFQGLQIGTSWITNRGSFRDFKSGQKDYKSGQGFEIRAKRFQIGAEITIRSKKNYKLGQGFKIGAGITNWCRIQSAYFQISLKYLNDFPFSSIIQFYFLISKYQCGFRSIDYSNVTVRNIPCQPCLKSGNLQLVKGNHSVHY